MSTSIPVTVIRDGSHYEFKVDAHYVSDEEVETVRRYVAALRAENAKLRELVADMWFWGYEGHMDGESQEWQMKHIDGVLDRMRELGVEV